MSAVCKLPRLPRKPADGAEVCDKYGNRWRFNGEQDSWISRGLLQNPVVVTESSDGIITTDIFDQLGKVRNFVNTGFDFRPLKLSPGVDAYWYYFRSSDKFIKFQPEGEDALRIEVDRGRLYQVLMKQICPGPRGDKGDEGDRGRQGKPGPAEICYEPAIEAGRLDFSIITPTPLLGDRVDIELPGNHVPDISVRVFKVTLPRRYDGPVVNKVGQKKKSNEVMVYDPLQYLASYYYGLPREAADFQSTRELLVQRAIGGTRTLDNCGLALSRVLEFPIDSVLERNPIVTVLVDPLGAVAPRVSFDRRYPVDVNKTLNTVQYDPVTGIVCGSIYLTAGLFWDGIYCVKSRQRGPDGPQGTPGEQAVKIVECILDSSSVFATCPIIATRLDCEQRAIFSICSDIMSSVCVEGVKLAQNAGALNNRTALNTSFASAQMVLDNCKLVERYEPALAEDEFEPLELTHWTPQPGCVSKRHYDRHKFNWVKETDIPACDEAVKWYGPNGLVRPGKYPWYIGKAKEPEQDSCCQEDFFYCPNVQVGCYNTDGSGGGGPPPPPPPPGGPPPPPPPGGPPPPPPAAQQLVGYGVAGTSYDFYLYDNQGRVWSGGAWTTWVNTNYLSYRVPAVEVSPGRFTAVPPSGAVAGLSWTEMRFRGGSLSASYVVWTDDDCN